MSTIAFMNTQCVSASQSEREQTKNIIEATAIGGHTAYISALTALDPSKAAENWRSFSQWAGSVKDLPTITSQKVPPSDTNSDYLALILILRL